MKQRRTKPTKNERERERFGGTEHGKLQEKKGVCVVLASCLLGWRRWKMK
jgi:hypothetical protein